MRQALRPFARGEDFVEILHEKIVDLPAMEELAVGVRPSLDKVVQETVRASVETVQRLLEKPIRKLGIAGADLEITRLP